MICSPSLVEGGGGFPHARRAQLLQAVGPEGPDADKRAHAYEDHPADDKERDKDGDKDSNHQFFL